MPELILIPCSSSKSVDNTHLAIPVGQPNILNELTPPLDAQLTAKRNLLSPLAHINNDGFAIAYERYRGTHAWQYNSFPVNRWINRVHPDTRVLIVSALFGLLNPYSFIPNYNLRMSEAIAVNVYHGLVKNFWAQNNFLQSCLQNYCLNNGIVQIHNLLTKDYSDAIQLPFFPVMNYHWTDHYGHHRGEWLGNRL